MKTMGGSAGNSLMSPSTSAPLVTISAALKVGSLNESISSNTNNSKTHLNNALSHQNSCQTVDSLRSSHDDSGKFPLMSDIDTKTKTVVVVAADCADFVVRVRLNFLNCNAFVKKFCCVAELVIFVCLLSCTNIIYILLKFGDLL